MNINDILDQLDRCAADFGFPMLDNGYVYPVDVRMSIFRDVSDWLMIIEALGTNPRAGGYSSFQNCLHVFGSRLNRKPGLLDEDFLYPLEQDFTDDLMDDDYGWYLRTDVFQIPIRGRKFPIDMSPKTLSSKGIKLTHPPARDATALLRSLIPEHRLLLLASQEELAERNPKDLPLWLRLDEWNHPDLAGGEKPSHSETFRMLSETIAAGDKTLYRPTKEPNTHWRNWPDGGSL